MTRQLERFKRTMTLTLDGFSHQKLHTARYTLGDLVGVALGQGPVKSSRVCITLPECVTSEQLEAAYQNARDIAGYSRRMFLMDLMIKGRYKLEGNRAIS